MTSAPMILERFDAGEQADAEAQARDDQLRADAFAEGYAAGEAAALARGAARSELFEAAANHFAERLDRFDAEACVYLSNALATAARNVLPQLAAKGFAQETVETLRELTTRDATIALRLRTAPENVEALQEAVAETPLVSRSTVDKDEAMSGPVVQAEWDYGGLRIDAEKAAEDFAASLETVIQDVGNGV